MLEKEAQAQKFLFDLSFEPEALAAELMANKLPTFSLTQMDAEKQAAYEKGYKYGYEKAYQGIEEKISNTLDNLQEKTNLLISIEQLSRDQVYEDTILLSSHILHGILPSLLKYFQKNEIVEFIQNTISDLKQKIEIEIIVHPSMYAHVQPLIQKIPTTHHVSFTSDEEVSMYDCRIQWINGGKERLLTNFIENIDQQLNAFLINLTSTYDKIEAIKEKKKNKKPILENHHE